MDELGMTILHEGEDPVEADVIFVHGLAGSSHGTWSKGDKMWPRDFLKHRVPHARIMTWGYDNDPVHFFRRQGYQSILSHAQDLLADLKLERTEESEKRRPLIFVGHSLGGLVIKQAICKAVEYRGRRGHDREAAIGQYCAGVVFIGTPHRGADLAAWYTTAVRLAKAIGKGANDEIVASLKSGSPVLEGLQDTFAGIQSRFNIHTFLEANAMPGVGKVVEDYHATLAFENEIIASISADHRNMCKFSDEKDSGYRKLAGAIREQLEDAKTCLEQRAELIPQALGSQIQRSQPSQPIPAMYTTALNVSGDDPPSYLRSVKSEGVSAFDLNRLGNCLPDLSRQSTGQSDEVMTEHSRTLSDASQPSPSLPQRNEKLLCLANYKRLYQQTLVIEGPSPLEKHRKVIEVLKSMKLWSSSLESFRTIFNPENYDPNWEESKNKFLWLACYVGDKEIVSEALAAGADPNYIVKPLMDFPLNAALTFDHTEIIKMLLEAGSSLQPIVHELGANEQDHALRWLKTLSAASLTTMLQHCGKEAFPSEAVLVAASSNEPGVLQALYHHNFDLTVRNADGGTVLHVAIQHAKVETVDWLISIGFPVDCRDNSNQTPLFDAIMTFQPTMVDLLLTKHEASPNVRDKNGQTPVHMLVKHPADSDDRPIMCYEIDEIKVSMLDSLVSADASLEIADSQGNEPLHLACVYGTGLLAARMLEHGANPGALDGDGWTPLHLCAKGEGQQIGIAHFLISAGASMKVKLPSPHSLTPLELAKRFANADMVALLKNAKGHRGIDKWFARRGIS